MDTAVDRCDALMCIACDAYGLACERYVTTAALRDRAYRPCVVVGCDGTTSRGCYCERCHDELDALEDAAYQYRAGWIDAVQEPVIVITTTLLALTVYTQVAIWQGWLP